MTEQKIEQIVLNKFKAAFQAAQVDGVQFVGVWTPASDGQLKAFEDARAAGVLGVMVFPRPYATPTIPDAMFQVDVALTVRAEVDDAGQDYMKATEVVSQVLNAWQKAYQNYAEDFAIEDEFRPTGFNIESGDVGLSKEDCVWQYSATFNIYGITN